MHLTSLLQTYIKYASGRICKFNLHSQETLVHLSVRPKHADVYRSENRLADFYDQEAIRKCWLFCCFFVVMIVKRGENYFQWSLWLLYFCSDIGIIVPLPIFTVDSSKDISNIFLDVVYNIVIAARMNK